MPYRVAAIDVHKKVQMVVVATMAEEVDDAMGAAVEFECRRFGGGAKERKHLTAWLQERQVQEVVMESTAQYWRPIWLDLEPHFPKMHLAQAQSNKAPKGRKNDFKDAKRLARRLLAGELMLSYVPEQEQRGWRLMTRCRLQLVRERVRLQSHLEVLLEEARIKLSSVITDLLGVSGRRILEALAEGKTDTAELAELGEANLKCSKEELMDALNGSPQPCHLELLKLHMERLKILDKQIQRLSQMAAEALKKHPAALVRVARIPGWGAESSQQIIAEVGVDMEAFETPEAFASWAGVCPGSNVSAEENHSSHCPKGNRYVRRLLTEASHAAVKMKGCHFQIVFRRFLPKLGYNGAIGVIKHLMARILWKILHEAADYIERGQATTPRARSQRARKLTQALRRLGYAVTLTDVNLPSASEAHA
ncbi:MAG TPA: IS110 family transposase [Verrucomicrobiae bacterium]|nr:IS110 family transposase [Verrucomicrobiae bacterium]